MKILQLTKEGVETVFTKIVTNKKNSKKYHNLKHGSKRNRGWVWSASMDNRFFKLHTGIPIPLTSNDYLLKEIKKDGVILKDANDNVLYSISKTKFPDDDIMVLWKCNYDNFINITYKLSENIKLLGVSRNISDLTEVLEMPIFLVKDKCRMLWYGVCLESRKKYEQLIEFDGKTFNIGNLKEIPYE